MAPLRSGLVTDRFSTAWAKLARARKHLSDLTAEIHDFWATDPYQIEEVGSPRSGPGHYRIAGKPKPLPGVLPLVTGDAVHNLRSALDHFAWAAVPTGSIHVAFPVLQKLNPTPNQWQKEVTERLPGAAPALIDAVIALEAYNPGKGTETLWALHELDRVDKHRLVLSVAAAHTGIEIGTGAMLATKFPDSPFAPMPISLRPGRLEKVRRGLVLLRVQADNGLGSDPRFKFELLLGEPAPLRNKPVGETLRGIADEVERVLGQLEPLA